MRHLHILCFVLALVLISASRLQTTPLLKTAEQPAQTSSWFGSFWNKIYDWWYGKPSDCRDMVVWEPEDTSAEEWQPPRSDESDGSGGITSWSTSSGSEKDKMKTPKIEDDLSKSAYEVFFAKGETEEKPVWKGSLESTAEAKQSLEAPETALEGEENLDTEDVFKRSNPSQESPK